MEKLEDIQQLFEQAKKEPAFALEVVESIQRCVRPLAVDRRPLLTLTVWKIFTGVSALAAVIPLVLAGKTFLALNTFMIEFFPPSQEVWLW